MAMNPLDAPMGVTLIDDGVDAGATFRVWAPAAHAVAVRGSCTQGQDRALVPISDGHWYTFIAGVRVGDTYKFIVTGDAGPGEKRDPYARMIADTPPWPHSDCEVTEPDAFPWHDAGFRPPPFHEFVIYQLHIGTFYSIDEHGVDRRATRPGRFLDVLFRLEYLASLGITAIQLMPVQEFGSERSLGYNGTDLFSPEMDYSVKAGDPELPAYVAQANWLLAARGHAPYPPGALDGQTHQLLAVIDLCHVYGLAVIFDVVFNHAGGEFGDESIYFFDRELPGDNNRSLYFTDQGWAGGLVFAYWKDPVRQFLIDNARMLVRECHADGFRFDEVTVIARHGGWRFLQDLTDTVRYEKPGAPLIAEYWDEQAPVLRPAAEGGAGFDVAIGADLRNAIRGALAQAAHGAAGPVDLERVAAALVPPHREAWRLVVHLENHDIVRINNDTDREPRIARLADASNPRSWWARSRARVANGLLLTAPGIPMLFMGQERLEDRYWSDNPGFFDETLIGWDDLPGASTDHVRFVQDLLALRRAQPALTGDRIHVSHVHNANRVLAIHRWNEHDGRDVMIVATLSESTAAAYVIGFPRRGVWREVFNSDAYDGWVNPDAVGNGGLVVANGPPRDGLPSSASIVIPANGLLVFSIDA